MQPVYPKDNGYLEQAKEMFRKKVSNWNWNDSNDKGRSNKGRKPKPSTRVESRPRTQGERQALEQQKQLNKVKK